jgi:hypothetical protein
MITAGDGEHMYSVKLYKIKSSHSNLRTDEVKGIAEILPNVDKSFTMLGEPLLNGPRYITTSLVQSIRILELNHKIAFSTMNSSYELEYSEIIV